MPNRFLTYNAWFKSKEFAWSHDMDLRPTARSKAIQLKLDELGTECILTEYDDDAEKSVALYWDSTTDDIALHFNRHYGSTWQVLTIATELTDASTQHCSGVLLCQKKKNSGAKTREEVPNEPEFA